MNIFPECINYYFIDEHCQYWLNKEDGTLTSPNYGRDNNFFGPANYKYHGPDINCTWILNAEQGKVITLEFNGVTFWVNNDKKNLFL